MKGKKKDALYEINSSTVKIKSRITTKDYLLNKFRSYLEYIGSYNIDAYLRRFLSFFLFFFFEPIIKTLKDCLH